jgi:hypothetical protein
MVTRQEMEPGGHRRADEKTVPATGRGGDCSAGRGARAAIVDDGKNLWRYCT